MPMVNGRIVKKDKTKKKATDSDKEVKVKKKKKVVEEDVKKPAKKKKVVEEEKPAKKKKKVDKEQVKEKKTATGDEPQFITLGPNSFLSVVRTQDEKGNDVIAFRKFYSTKKDPAKKPARGGFNMVPNGPEVKILAALLKTLV